MFTQNLKPCRKPRRSKNPLAQGQYTAFTGEALVKDQRYLVEIVCSPASNMDIFTATAYPLGYVSQKRIKENTVNLIEKDAIFPTFYENPFNALAAIEAKFQAMTTEYNGWVNWETWYLFTAITGDESTLLYFQKFATADELAQQFKNLAVRTRVLGFSEHNIRNIIFRDIAQAALENVNWEILSKRLKES